jgi:serine protease Do
MASPAPRRLTVYKPMHRVFAGVALSVIMIVGATGLSGIRDGRAFKADGADLVPQAQIAQVTRATNSDADPEALSRAFRTAAKRSLPAVVYVQVEQRPSETRRTPLDDPQQPRQGSGSGFIFRPDGYILTNNHVIEGATRVTVVLPDRREFTAQVVGRDPNTDVAVIRIDASDLPVVPIGESDGIDVGDWVVALGYPLSLGSTATAGIVSAKGRSLGILRQNGAGSASLEHFIQTDAAINPGNSGGPLVDLNGHAVGINSAIASPTGFFSGYGFAVPINLARRVAEDLIRYGEPHRPRLGVGIADVDPVDAEVYRLDSVSGVEITQITPGEPAQRAGLRIGDVIVAVEGRPITSTGHLMESLALYQPRQRVKLGVIRYGKPMDFGVELGEFKPVVSADAALAPEPPTGAARLGFKAAEITPAYIRTFGLPVASGVVVTQVDPTSGAYRAQLQRGHVIESINGESVRTIPDLERIVSGLKAGATVSMIARGRDPEVEEGVRTILNFRVRG